MNETKAEFYNPPAQDNDQVEESDGSIAVISSQALSVIAKSDIEMQIATARRFPRSVTRFKQSAMSLVQLDEDTALSCMYTLPRGGKSLEGPSVRFAELMASCWTNVRIGARVVNEEARFLTAQGVCHDLQTNVAITVDVQRRITNRSGARFNDDMIVVTGNAAASLALRNSILRVVPRALWWPVFQAARATALGDARTLESKRQACMEYFAKYGLSVERICSAAGKAGAEDLSLSDLLLLRSLGTSIKDGEMSIEEAFPEPGRDEHGSDRNGGNGRKQTAPKSSAKEKAIKEKVANKAQDEPAEPKPQQRDVETDAKDSSVKTPEKQPDTPSATPAESTELPMTKPDGEIIETNEVPPVTDSEIVADDVENKIAKAIDYAQTLRLLESAPGRDMIRNRELLGEMRYKRLSAKYDSKRQELLGAAKKGK